VTVDLDARLDWLLRYVAFIDGITTQDVLSGRQQIDPAETNAKILTSLKRLQKAGLVKSTKDGTQLHWSVTEAGSKAYQ
jgi:predicted MarR family transcription regulator